MEDFKVKNEQFIFGSDEKDEKKEKKKKIIRYDDIKRAINRNEDPETQLLLNELTLARNLESKAINKKEYGFARAVIIGEDGSRSKRAGIYMKEEMTEEDAEDILATGAINDDRILVVPRGSMYAEAFK